MISNNLGNGSLQWAAGHDSLRGQKDCRARRLVAFALLAAATGLFGAQAADAKKLYRYQDADGVWHFTDVPPASVDAQAEPVTTQRDGPRVDAAIVDGADGPELLLTNGYWLAVQVGARVGGVGATEQIVRVVDARASTRVPLPPGTDPQTPVTRGWVLGDPAATHRPERPYRVPFAVGASHRVTQGFHGGLTHRDEASEYAIDIAMPVGTGIVAARAGIVTETAYANYAGGTGPQRPGVEANLVRIVHDDGTFAVYAHLDRASVRVRPGQRVARGEPIAASGNTGFSTGPHLHFAVLRNGGGKVVSVPFSFAGRSDGEAVVPRQGEMLTAYP